MPGTSAPTTEYIFETFFVDSAVDYLVDRSRPQNLLTATPGSITVASVTSSTMTAYESATYTFTFQPKNNVAKDGKVVVELPADVTISDPGITQNTCTALEGYEITFSCTATS